MNDESKWKFRFKYRLAVYMSLWLLAAVVIALITHDPSGPFPEDQGFQYHATAFLKAPLIVAGNLTIRIPFRPDMSFGVAQRIVILYLLAHGVLMVITKHRGWFIALAAIHFLQLAAAVASFTDLCWFHPGH